MIASVTSTGTSISPGARAARAPAAVRQAEPRGVVGVHVQRAALLALHEHAAGCASTSCSSAAGGGRSARGRRCAARRARRAARSTSRRSARARARSCPTACAAPRAPRLERPEVDAVRAALEHVERQPVRVGAEAVAVGAGAQHEVEQPLGAAARLERRRAARSGRGPRRASPASPTSRWTSVGDRPGRRARRRRRSAPWPADDARQAQEDLPLGRRRSRLEHRRRVVGHVAHRELVEREVVVRLLERRRRRAGSRRRGGWSRSRRCRRRP